MNVGATTGVILDPTYTGKAVRGMVSELQVNPDRFQGNRILFIHTGIYKSNQNKIRRGGFNLTTYTGTINVCSLNDYLNQYLNPNKICMYTKRYCYIADNKSTHLNF